MWLARPKWEKQVFPHWLHKPVWQLEWASAFKSCLSSLVLFLQFDSAIKVTEKNLYLALLATTENEGPLQRLLVSLQGCFHFYINQRQILQLGESLENNCPSSLLCIQTHYSWVIFCRASTCGFGWVFYLAILYREKLKKKTSQAIKVLGILAVNYSSSCQLITGQYYRW